MSPALIALVFVAFELGLAIIVGKAFKYGMGDPLDC